MGAILLGACLLTVQRMTTNWATATVEETKKVSRFIQAYLTGNIANDFDYRTMYEEINILVTSGHWTNLKD